MAVVKWVFVVLFYVCTVYGERTSQKIYQDMQSDYACFRRLNATHQIGCSSARKGNVGVVHYISTTEDFDWLIENGPHAPYTVILEPLFVNMGNLTKLKASGKINGVIVGKRNRTPPSPDGFSPAETCPNNKFGMYREKEPYSKVDGCSVPWNSVGEGILYNDWTFPIFLLNNMSDIETIQNECYEKFNAPINGTPRSWPLCAVELMNNMLAAKDSVTCMRRSQMVTNLNPMKWCDPLGDYNIWSTLYPMNKSEDLMNRSLIILSARLDAYSMYYNLAPGADSAITGLITLIAAADILTQTVKEIDDQQTNKNVLFTIFNGESFDYIGSSRMVYDMENGKFPSPLDPNVPSQPPVINLAHVGHFIELNQVGLVGPKGKFWVHTDPVSTGLSNNVNSTVTNMLKLLNKYSSDKNISINLAEPALPLPPASLQSFLWRDLEIPGIVITDHEKQYENIYYNSIFDTNETLGYTPANKKELVQHITSLTTVVVETVLELLFEKKTIDVYPNSDQIEKLLDCYLVSVNCSLFSKLLPDSDQRKKLPNTPPQLYIGVEGTQNQIRALTTLLMTYLTGFQLQNISQKDCVSPADETVYTYRWMGGGNDTNVCIKSTVNISKALSPTFLTDDTESYPTSEYSTWTESVWEEFSMRIFLKPSRHQESVTLGIGILILFLSFFVVWFISVNSEVLFQPKISPDC